MRYIAHSDDDRRQMMATIGVESVNELFADVPDDKLLDGLLDLPMHKGELEVERLMTALSDKNLPASRAPFFCGAGAYKHHIPATVDHLIQRSEFLTAYTPYQPEIAQGTLQYLFEFQTQVALVTGMDVANASMYDGATSTAEAVLMAHRIGKKKKKSVLSGALHPHYRDVVKTMMAPLGLGLDCLPADPMGTEDIIAAIDDDTACVVVQYPDFYGRVKDLTPIAEACHAKGALLVTATTEWLSLGHLKAPGDMGADIVTAEGAGIGVGLNFGGPYLGLFATNKKYVRQMPGRLCGETVDADGRRGFVLTLNTREQHIRREKATSNICTNAGLCALAFTIHMSLLGSGGFSHLAKLNHAYAVQAVDKLAKVNGVEVLNDTFFNEVTLKLSKPAADVVNDLAAKGILAGVPVSRLDPNTDQDNLMLVAITETTTDDDVAGLCAALEGALS